LKPPRFKYAAVESVEEAVAILDEYGDEAKVLAGGQSLIPLMNMRLARPGVLVDINRVSGLDGIQRNGGLTIGALARQSSVLRSGDVSSFAPIVAGALRHVGHPGIRTRGTIGGSIAHADPAAELPAVLLALDGEAVARGPGGERTIPAEELFVTNFTTSLEQNEILTSIRLPWPLDKANWAFLEVSRRHGDFALAGVASAAELEKGTCESVRIALFAVADRPLRAKQAEGFLVGKKLGDASVVEEAARLACADLEPHSDFHATSQYRKEASEALVRRALRQMSTEGGS
jgi:carbon-monoxide dehydrogenase medium subunit